MNRGQLVVFRSSGQSITIPNFPDNLFPDIAKMPGENHGRVMIEFNDGLGRIQTHWIDQVTGMSFTAY